MLNRATRSFLAIFTFIFVSIVNPLYFVGCGTGGDDFDFGEAEMLAVVQQANSTDTWTFTYQARTYTVDVTLAQAVDMNRTARVESFETSAFACGNRSFYQSASACITVSELPVTGTLTLRDTTDASAVTVLDAVAVTGAFRVYGEHFGYGELDLAFGGDNRLMLSSDTTTLTLKTFYGRGLGESEVNINY